MKYTTKMVNEFSIKVGALYKVMIWTEDGIMLGEALRKPFGRTARWLDYPKAKAFPIKLDSAEGLWIKA